MLSLKQYSTTKYSYTPQLNHYNIIRPHLRRTYNRWFSLCTIFFPALLMYLNIFRCCSKQYIENATRKVHFNQITRDKILYFPHAADYILVNNSAFSNFQLFLAFKFMRSLQKDAERFGKAQRYYAENEGFLLRAKR